ncbi:MAG: ATP-binding protein [Bacteroidia bacterium]
MPPSFLIPLPIIPPPTPKPALLFWSGGKDSALALHKILSQKSYVVKSLLTTLSPEYQVTGHGIPLSLLDQQARSIGIPLHLIPLPHPCSNHQYETLITQALLPFQQKGIYHCIFGDIFLEDIRAYREALLAPIGMKALFPLWHLNPTKLVQKFIALGFKAIVTTLDPQRIPLSFLGREINLEFLADLPPHVDPCGENGEFHTFVYDGPLFKHPITFQ